MKINNRRNSFKKGKGKQRRVQQFNKNGIPIQNDRPPKHRQRDEEE